MEFLRRMGVIGDSISAQQDSTAPSTPPRALPPPAVSYRAIQLSDAATANSAEASRPAIEAVPIRVPDDPSNKFALFLRNVFTPEEVKMLVDLTESIGYIPAKVNVGGGREIMIEDYRKSDRCIIDSNELAAQLWDRIQSFVPAIYRYRAAIGVNERFRFLRYNPGDFFERHRDGSYVRGLEKGPEHSGEVSLITIQIYLSTVEGGGATTVYNPVDESKFLRVVPEPGSVFLFEHSILHDGELVTKGRKYAVRTEVMYSADEIAP